MDPKLAELYGTNQIEAESVAADELAEKLAASEEMNVDGLSDEDAETLAQEILSATSEEQVENAEETETEESSTETTEEETPAEEETEKVAQAQADYLGRVMAHAFTQELREIEKQASAELEKEAKFDFKAMKDGAQKGAGKVGNFLKDKGGKAKDMAKANPGKAGAAAGAAGGFAAGRFSKKKKEAAAVTEETTTLSAFDTLAQQRAFEILKANGIDLAASESVETEETEKTSAPENEDNKYEALAQKVDERAWAMLSEAGYTKAEEEVETDKE